MFYHINKWSCPMTNHQGLCPSLYPRADSGFSISLGDEHLKYDHFKTYVDQGVHFQIIINKAVLHVYSLSPVCKLKCFEMRPAHSFNTKPILLHRDVRAELQLIIRMFLYFLFQVWEAVNIRPLDKPKSSKQWMFTDNQLVRAHSDGRLALYCYSFETLGLLMLNMVTPSYPIHCELHRGTNIYCILKLVDQVTLFHYRTAVTPPIKGFRCKSIVIRRLAYSNQTFTIGGVTICTYF